ncbi:MAG: tetratricopeptide repeat protein [Candidatus Methanofastidiosia archaeon]|jgi:tetratricopeptide (TPR) repeat protein
MRLNDITNKILKITKELKQSCNTHIISAKSHGLLAFGLICHYFKKVKKGRILHEITSAGKEIPQNLKEMVKSADGKISILRSVITSLIISFLYTLLTVVLFIFTIFTAYGLVYRCWLCFEDIGLPSIPEQRIYFALVPMFGFLFALYFLCRVYQNTASAYNNLGLAYAAVEKWDKAIKCYEKSLKIVLDLGDLPIGLDFGKKLPGISNIELFAEISKLDLSVYNNLGLAYVAVEKWDKAIEYYRKGLDIEKNFGKLSEIYNTEVPEVSTLESFLSFLKLLKSGLLKMLKKGDLDTVLKYRKNILKIHRDIGHKQREAADLCNIGNLYFDKGDSNSALKYYEDALKIYINLGSIFKNKGKWDKAIEYYEKSLEISEKIGDLHGIALIYINLGSIFKNKGKWDKAIEYYEKSLEISEKIGDLHGIAQTKYETAYIFRQEKELNDALRLNFESERILKKLGDRFNLINVYYNLFLCYKDMNQEEKAKEYLQKAEKLRKNLGIEFK